MTKTIFGYRIPVFLVLSVLISSLAMAQTDDTVKVVPGDGTLDGSFIVSYTNSWKMIHVSVDGDSSIAGTWTDSVAVFKRDGRTVLERFQVVYKPTGEERVHIHDVVDHKSLEPIEGELRTANGAYNMLRFAGRHVTGEINGPEIDPVAIDTLLDQAAYDFNIYGTLLLGFPFEQGYRAKFPIVEIHQKENYPYLSWVPMTVGDEATTEAGHLGERRTRTVTTNGSDGELKFSLSKEPPYVIKLVRTLPDSSLMIWVME